MSFSRRLSIACSFAVIAFGVGTFLRVRGNVDAAGLTLWGAFPQLAALFVLIVARDTRTQWLAAGAVALFCIAGGTVFWNGGPQALFLPIAEVAFLAVALVILTLARRQRA